MNKEEKSLDMLDVGFSASEGKMYFVVYTQKDINRIAIRRELNQRYTFQGFLDMVESTIDRVIKEHEVGK